MSPARLSLFLVAVLFAVFATLGPAEAVPPTTPDRVVAARAAPLATGKEVWTGAQAAGAWNPIFADLPAGKFGIDGVTQNVTIESSRANTTRFCVLVAAIPIPVVLATDTCSEVCTSVGSGRTCNETSTDGEWVDPGETFEEADTAQFCYCGRSASLTPVAQGRRIAR